MSSKVERLEYLGEAALMIQYRIDQLMHLKKACALQGQSPQLFCILLDFQQVQK